MLAGAVIIWLLVASNGTWVRRNRTGDQGPRARVRPPAGTGLGLCVLFRHLRRR